MLSFTKKSFDCFAAKRAMRSSLLKKLRSWALSYPDERQEYSIAICDTLFNYLYDKYLFTKNDEHERYVHKNRGTSGASVVPLRTNGFSVERRQLYVCATLPLYYEVDLLPLLKRLWSWRQENQTDLKLDETSYSAIAHTELYTMVPTVVDPNGVMPKRGETNFQEGFSAPYAEWHYPIADAHKRLHRGMTFVELYDAKDLKDSFEIRGPMKLCELKNDEFESFFVREHATNHGLENHGNEFPGIASHNSRHPRLILPCEDWENMFPEHLPPPGLVRFWGRGNSFWHHRSFQMPQNNPNVESIDMQRSNLFNRISEVKNVDVVVLTPGVCFQRFGGLRLGKGGGFYDRFLNYMRHQIENDRMTPVPAPQNMRINSDSDIEVQKHITVEAIGIGFDQQVLNGEWNFEDVDSLWGCVNDEDARVDAIVTPSTGVVKIDHIHSHRFNIGKGEALHFQKTHSL
ncbi:unnamed protein product [Phytomonas sp. Hart1]|nr:unnamed protein product [Phytomonas sp. Hart1]|eukprot:CCW68314.1 unnamed protein product [Phytomonas sp. isolate Hart1]